MKSTTVPYYGELSPTFTVDAVINSGAQESQAIDLGSLTLVGVVTPASITGTTASWEVCVAGTTYLDIYDEFGNLVTTTLAGSRFTVVDILDFIGAQDIKVKMGSAQATTTTLTLVAKH